MSIIVPVKNEPDLDDFLLRLFDAVHSEIADYEVIIVMGDREKLFPNIPSLPNQRVIKTYGDSLERSILTGFSFARGSKVVVCDADGYHPVDKIPEMIRLLGTYEMVAGSRYIPGGELNMSWFRSLVSRCFVFYAHLLGSRLSDPMTGFFAVRKDVIDKVVFKPFTWKICLEIDMKAKPKLVEIPIVPKPRTVGASKTSLRTGLKLARDMING